MKYIHRTGYGLRGRQARTRGSLLRDGVLLWVDPRESHRRRSLAHVGPLWLLDGRTLHQMLKEDEFTRRLADCEEIETLAGVDTLARGAGKDPRLRTAAEYAALLLRDSQLTQASPSTAARPCMRPCIPPHYPFLTALLSLCDGLRQAEDALCRHLDRNITLVESVPSAHCSDY